MHRLPVQMLLFGCAGVLLGIQGCANPAGEDAVSARQEAGGRKTALPRAAADVAAPFRLPEDDAGVLLGAVLPPTACPGVMQNPLRPAKASWPTPPFLEPSLPLPSATLDLPRLPDVVKKTAVQPEFAQEEGLEDTLYELQPPSKPAFVTGKRTRVESEDVALPPPLPVLARPTPDRVSLDDPTMEASTLAVLSAPVLAQRKPAPYQRMTVPEPYEHHRPLTMTLPEERPAPVAATPRPPNP